MTHIQKQEILRLEQLVEKRAMKLADAKKKLKAAKARAA